MNPNSQSSDSAKKIWPVRVAKGRWLSLWDKPMTLEVGKGVVSLSLKGQTVFSSVPQNIRITHHGLESTPQFLTMKSGADTYRLDFRVGLKITKAGNFTATIKNRDEFISALEDLGVANLPHFT